MANVGIIGCDRIPVSLAAQHFINKSIHNTNKLSVNHVNEDILKENNISENKFFIN